MEVWLNKKKLMSLFVALTLVVSLFNGMLLPVAADESSDSGIAFVPFKSGNAKIITMIYSGGKASTVTISETIEVTKDVPVPYDDMPLNAKAFLWEVVDGKLTMNPLAKPVSTIGVKPKPKVLFTEDFDDNQDSLNFTTTTGGGIKLIDGTTNYYLSLTEKNNSGNRDKGTLPEAVSSAPVIDVEFDFMSTVDIDNTGGGRASFLNLTDENENIIFSIEAATSRNAPQGLSCYPGAEPTASAAMTISRSGDDEGKWFKINLTVDFIGQTVEGTVKNSTGTTVVTIDKTPISATELKYIVARNVSSLAPMAIDNIKITESANAVKSTFTITGGVSGKEKIAGAEIKIGPKTFYANDKGQAQISMLPGNYEVTVIATRHNIYKGSIAVSAESANFPITLSYVGELKVTSIEVTGGDEYIYQPSTGTLSTQNPYVAIVYDQTGQPMDNEEVTWSIAGYEDKNYVSIENGIVTLTSDFPVGDINGENIVIRATSKTDPAVKGEKTLFVRQAQRLSAFTVAGPLVVKDGFSATYSAVDFLDQYGEPMTCTSQPTLTTDNAKIAVDGLKITPNTGVVNILDAVVTLTIEGVSQSKNIQVYGYDFYEPGREEVSYGTNVRMEVMNGQKVLVWPVGTTTKIEFPEPIALAPGTAKKLTFNTAYSGKGFYTGIRDLAVNDANGNAILKADFHSQALHYELEGFSVSSDGTISNSELLGEMPAENTLTECIMVFKTNAEGETTVDIQFAGAATKTFKLGTNIGSLGSISLYAVSGCPLDRLISFTDIKFSDNDIADIEILGDSFISKIYNQTAQKKFTASVFSRAEGETFSWSVADENGNAINGVTIDENGVLSVADSTTATTAVIKYASNTNAEKFAARTIEIRGYAQIASFDIEGPAAVNYDNGTASYSIANIVDEYGDTVPAEKMPATWAITNGNAATINSQTGELTITGTGQVTISATLGNPDKTKTVTKDIEIAKYSYIATGITSPSVTVNVSELANYTADTNYLVTTATADKVLVKQYETKATDGKIDVDMTGATAVEVSPIYFFNNVGNVANGYTIKIADGVYDFTFAKTNDKRSDIFVNGVLVGNNVGQDGKGRVKTTPLYYTAKDIKVRGGSANIAMYDVDSYMTSITVKKAPSIVNRKTKVYVLGDSLVAEYLGDFKDTDGDGIPAPGDAQSGWGQFLQKFVSDEIEVVNLAESGSTGEGLYNSAFKGVLANGEAGDYVLFECGYNDRNYSSQAKMKEALEKVVAESRAKDMIPILVTPNASAHDFKESVVWADTVVSVAQSTGAFLVDLSKLSYKYLSDKGIEWTKMNINIYYSGSSQDSLHSSFLGAYKFAEIVAQEIADQQAKGTKDSEGKTLDGIIINKNFSITLTDSEGNAITLQVK